MSSVSRMGLVLVEFEYQYTGRDGAMVSIKPNERYILLAKTNDHWWHVRKDQRAKPFYIPAKYVKELPAEFPSPLDFANPPSPEPILVPLPVPMPVPVPVPVPRPVLPDRAEETRPGDEVTIRLRSPKGYRGTENRMSTFGVPLEFHDPPPVVPHTNDGGRRRTSLKASGSLFGSSKTLSGDDQQQALSLKPRVPSFSPADPVLRPNQAIPVEPPVVPEPEATPPPIPLRRESLEEPDSPLELEEEEEEEESSTEPEELQEDSENIYESILDLKLDELPIGGTALGGPALDPAAVADPLPAAPTSSSPPLTQTDHANPNTAVYANVTELKRNASQLSPPLETTASSNSTPSSSVASPGDLSPAPPPLQGQKGWQVHTDKDSGKEFYYQPATGHSTWADPRSPAPSTTTSTPADMDRPRELLAVPSLSPAPSPALSPTLSPALSPSPSPSPAFSPAFSPLPSPALSTASSQGSNWEQLLDETTGRHYYHNPASGATSWAAPEPLSPSSPGSEPPGLKRGEEGPPPLPEEDYPTEDPESPDTPSSVFPRLPLVPGVKQAVIPRASLDTSTPAGWARSLDHDGKTVFTSERTQEQWFRSEDEKGKTYYYLRDGSRSQWNLPKLPAAPIMPRVGNGVDQDGPPVLKNWRHTLAPSQLAPSQEDNKFFPAHRRNMSDMSDVSSSGTSPETPHHAQLLEKAGILNKTRVAEHGKRIRKNWGQSWTVLHGGILTFHRDPKSAPTGNSNKSSQIVPEYTVELRGASLACASRDKSSKKNVLELKTRHGCEYLIQYDTESIIHDWHKVILDTIRQLDKDHLSEEEEEEPRDKSPLPGDKDDKERKRTSTRSTAVESSEQGRVRTKLRKFLQRRPTLQSVKEKGYIRDNVFGCHLDTLCHRENSTVPKFVERCIRAVERRGLDIDGIYRVSGNLAVIQRLRHKADHDLDLDLEDGQWEEIHVITGALKLFLRELPEPLFPFSFFEKFIAAIQIQDYNQKVSYFRDLVRSLPLPNHDTMEFLFKHLRKVIEYGEANRMSVQSVAIVFGPTLLRPLMESANITIHMVFQNQIVELILNEYETIFSPR